ncbi:MAG: T9SS type A sorting domain-containing protein, partial [Bacteroidota bacterium]
SDQSESVVITTPAPNQPPVPIISASVLQGEPPLEVRFDGSQSFDPEGDNLIYAWLVNDRFQGNSDTLNYIFDEPGTYKVTLVLEDGRLIARDSVEVLVDIPLSLIPKADDFTVYPNPAHGSFFIKSSLNEINVSIFDFSGKLYRSFEHDHLTTSSYSLPPGIYTLIITSMNGRLRYKKLIII